MVFFLSLRAGRAFSLGSFFPRKGLSHGDTPVVAGRREGRRKGEQEERGRLLCSFITATLCPAWGPGRGALWAQTGFLEEQGLLLPDLAHLPSTCCSCRRSARELSSRENKALVFSKEAVQPRKAADQPEVCASHSHPPEWLPACVTVTLTAATPVLPALHPCVHGSEATFALPGPLTPCSVL